MNGTIFVIGATHGPTVTGFYTWGFTLSSQAIYLLAINLQSVFFPALCKLNGDVSRQREAFGKACRLLILAIAPVCALQIVLAQPVIELLFHARWLPAVPVVQWLSVGMATQPFSILGTSLLLARGQYRLLALSAVGVLALIAAASLLGAWWGRQAEIARCTGTALFFSNLGIGWVAIRELKTEARFFFWKLTLPVLVLVPLLLTGTWLAFLTRNWPPVISIAAATAMLLAFYGGGIAIFAPALTREISSRARSFLAR